MHFKKTALQCADRIIQKNKEEFQHDGEEAIDEDEPLLSRFKYTQSLGKKRTWTQAEKQNMEGLSKPSSSKALQDSEAFLECMGPAGQASIAAAAAEDTSSVQIWNAKWDELEGLCKKLRTELGKLVVYKDPLRTLLAKLKNKAQTNANFRNFSDELIDIINKMGDFIGEVEATIYEFEAIESDEASAHI